MAYSNYSDIRHRLRWRESFRGNSSRAEWVSGYARYCVWSYDTLMYSEPENEGLVYINLRNYSTTTRKLQTMISTIAIGMDRWRRFQKDKGSGPIYKKRKYLHVPREEMILDFPNDDAYLIRDTEVQVFNDGRVEGTLTLPFETAREFAF